MARIAALVVAAGRGSRAGGDCPKQYADLGGKPVLGRTLDALAASGIAQICVVIGAEDRELFDAFAKPSALKMLVAEGGSTRQESVRNGLAALAAHPPDLVLIHDGARPFVSDVLVARLTAAAATGIGAIPGLAVPDSLKRVEGERITGPVAREGVYAVQTPQAFPFPQILEAHRHAASIGQHDSSDDATVAALAGLEVRVVEGDPDNIKITVPADFARAEAILERRMETRTGQGYDVHAFGPGKSVWLCGVEVPHELGLTGHSDADVGLHALTDAVLGAIGDGDIGMHFPPSDPKWKGASSDRFLADAVRRVTERGGRIVHLDVTMVCEAPKVGPHREEMRETIAGIAGIGIDRVGVKATTSEGLGFTGRREGIAAMAIATVKLPIAP